MTMDKARKYRVLAHGCYVHGLEYISRRILDMPDPWETAAISYQSGLDQYPCITAVSVIPETDFSSRVQIGALTIRKVKVIANPMMWRITEKTQDYGWVARHGAYHSFAEAYNVMRDITRLRSNRLHALGNMY